MIKLKRQSFIFALFVASFLCRTTTITLDSEECGVYNGMKCFEQNRFVFYSLIFLFFAIYVWNERNERMIFYVIEALICLVILGNDLIFYYSYLDPFVGDSFQFNEYGQLMLVLLGTTVFSIAVNVYILLKYKGEQWFV